MAYKPIKKTVAAIVLSSTFILMGILFTVLGFLLEDAKPFAFVGIGLIVFAIGFILVSRNMHKDRNAVEANYLPLYPDGSAAAGNANVRNLAAILHQTFLNTPYSIEISEESLRLVPDPNDMLIQTLPVGQSQYFEGVTFLSTSREMTFKKIRSEYSIERLQDGSIHLDAKYVGGSRVGKSVQVTMQRSDEGLHVQRDTDTESMTLEDLLALSKKNAGWKTSIDSQSIAAIYAAVIAALILIGLLIRLMILGVNS